MALTTPVLFNFPAFDANVGYTFSFNVVGGSLVKKNKLIIRRNSDNVIVYQEIQTTDEYKHVLSPSASSQALTNGTYYNASIVTLDAQDNESNPSTPIQFWCYTTPTIKFNNLIESQVIDKSSYRFEFEYNQLEGEKLNSYEINLYDITGKVISTSGRKLPVNNVVPYVDNYNFTGFIDSAIYSVEVEGITVQDTIVSTGKIRFNVKYDQPPIYSQLQAYNNCQEGYILVSSNVSLIEGESNGIPVYIDNHEISVKGEDDYVKFDKGYFIQNDFTLRTWFRSPNANKTLIKLSNGKENVIVKIREVEEPQDCGILWNNDPITTQSKAFWNEDKGCNINWNAKDSNVIKKVYVELIADSGTGKHYYIYSDYIKALPDTEYYVLWIKRKNNLFDIDFASKGA